MYGRRTDDVHGPLPVKDTLIYVFKSSTRGPRLLTILIHLSIIYGFLSRDLSPYDNDDLDFMYSHGPHWAWALALLYVVVSRCIGLFYWVGWKWTRRTTPMIAMYVYIMLIISNWFAPDFGMAAAYSVVILLELHLLARAYHEDKLGIL